MLCSTGKTLSCFPVGSSEELPTDEDLEAKAFGHIYNSARVKTQTVIHRWHMTSKRCVTAVATGAQTS